MNSSARPAEYHHGRSPAAWTGSVMAAIGFVIASVASMLGPNWTLVIVGGALVLLGGVATLIMKAMGYGQS